MSNRTPIQIPLPIEGATIEIPLTQGQVTVIDVADADLAQYKWLALYSKSYADGGKYLADRHVPIPGTSRQMHQLMHRVILSRMLGRELLRTERVDHKDLNPLNNRRSNLRLATPAQNVVNSPTRSDNSSGYKGVTFKKDAGKWCARVSNRGKRIHLGYFDTAEDAYEAYCKAASEIYGEYLRP
jgi:hypothetical protein